MEMTEHSLRAASASAEAGGSAQAGGSAEAAGSAAAGGSAEAAGSAEASQAVLSPKALRTRDALLDATESLLDSGREVVSGAVAAQAGMATGTFYRYFSDKDALLAAAFARALDRIISTVEEALSPQAVLDHGVPAVITTVVDDVAIGYAASASVIAAALGRMPGSTAIREVYRDRHGRAVAVLATFLTRLQRAGLASVPDVQATATAAVVLIQGLNHPAVRSDRDGQIRAQLRTALAALIPPPEPTAR